MLGDLSAKYESSGNPGSISSGIDDPGGKSYGSYQLSSNAGSVAGFINWAINISGNSTYQQYGEALNNLGIATDEFDEKWQEIAAADGWTFDQMQHDYIAYAYFFPATDALRDAGFDSNKHGTAMQDVIWSRAVQYGAGRIVEMFEAAAQRMYNADTGDCSGYPNLTYVDDAKFDYDLIQSIYLKVCATDEWTTPSCRFGLYRRFDEECEDALAMCTGGDS